MEHSYKGRERKGEYKTYMHEHTHTHTLHGHMQTTQHITDLYTLELNVQSLHAQIENTHTHTHTLWYSHKQGSLRVNGVETQGP